VRGDQGGSHEHALWRRSRQFGRRQGTRATTYTEHTTSPSNAAARPCSRPKPGWGS